MLRLSLIPHVVMLVIAMPAIAGCQERDDKDKSRPDTVTIGDERYQISTHSESQARVAKFPQLRASEDAHGLLVRPAASPQRDPTTDDIASDTSISWVVDAEFPAGTVLDVDRLKFLHSEATLAALGRVTMFGFDPAAKRWTYLFSSDGPQRISRLKFAWLYFSTMDSEDDQGKSSGNNNTERTYTQHISYLRTLFAKGIKVALTPSATPAAAAGRSALLWRVGSQCDYLPVLVVKAPEGATYDGIKVWDVLTSLGLEWGDGDYFHWVNESGGGDESYFMVATSTEPGYFLPEEVAAGEMHPADIQFAFSVPRCATPLEVFNAMLAAAEYARRRLGGTLLDGDGRPADPDAIRARISVVVKRLASIGFAPGVGRTLEVF